ncbi:hypothetical protein H632_c321p1 [Helicosporidium sp. ATCC 50920]|nr:hypothetical protein H632_c321p1 [Helicosporidium sp. ATCC 50920]|eukprot:KDD76190.1 hypothetical protein H632_c321p1 [Helicosporidium sp. ATCC 50920]
MGESFCGLKRYHACQKALNSICKEFTKEAGRKILVGFGNRSDNDPSGIIKGRPAGPVNALKKRLCHYCPVVSINEHERARCITAAT